jgi:hypothetical protein
MKAAVLQGGGRAAHISRHTHVQAAAIDAITAKTGHDQAAIAHFSRQFLCNTAKAAPLQRLVTQFIVGSRR